MQRWAVISGGIGLVLVGILCWREWTLRTALADRHAQVTVLESERSALAARVAEAGRRVEKLETELVDLQTERQTLNDRITNLEAQRDHLRTESEHQANRALEAEDKIALARKEAEQARHDLLQQSRLPNQLRAQVEEAQAQIARLERLIDRREMEASQYPEPLLVEGIATDGNVLAITGEFPDGTALPLPVYICQRDQIILEGWIHRMEGLSAITHVGKWHAPASALVKGEKVFILPK